MKSSDLARELGVSSKEIIRVAADIRGVLFKKNTRIIKLTVHEVEMIRAHFLVPDMAEGSTAHAAIEDMAGPVTDSLKAVDEEKESTFQTDEMLKMQNASEVSAESGDDRPQQSAFQSETVAAHQEDDLPQISAWHNDLSTLETRHLGKSYGSKIAVRDVSFSVQTGEVVGLLGPNGAGKTTTFYMVVGAIRPDAGEILLNGKDLRSMPMYKRALHGLGYLPQEPSIFRKLTVRQNLKAVLEVRWKSIKKKEDQLDIDEEVQGLLEEFNLTEFADRDGYRLSGGERRRTEIARAVALRPTFLLFDEPFAGIDPIAIIELKKMIVYLKQKGLGILITDHNVRETLSITDRAYIIKDGTVFAAGDPETLVGNKQVREAYLGEDFRLS
jgi:lipopolysaccharide export system ATP-binding protein